MCLRPHSAGSTIPRLRPTGSSLGIAPVDYEPVVLHKPFGPRLAAGALPSRASSMVAPGRPIRVPAFAVVPHEPPHTFHPLWPVRRYPHLRISVRGPGPSGTSTHLTRQLPGTHSAPCSKSSKSDEYLHRTGRLLDPTAERMNIHHSGMPGRNLPVLEEEQRRDALDPEFGGELWFGIDVDPDQPSARLKRLRRALEHGRHRPAGSAPGRPEIRDDRNVGAGEMAPEALAGQLDRLALKQFRAAVAALGSLRRPVPGNAIDPVAIRAEDMECIGHRQSPSRSAHLS